MRTGMRALAHLAQLSSSSSSTPSAARRKVQNEARSSLGGQATPACRWKQPLTSCVHADDECPYCHDEACEKRYGLSPVSSKAMLRSYASTKGWMGAGSVEICGP